MPHKIGFVVVSSSGHEDGFSARELMIHAPTVRGWRSPRNVQIRERRRKTETPAQVSKRVPRCPPRLTPVSVLSCGLGLQPCVGGRGCTDRTSPAEPALCPRSYVSLCDNEKTGCRARELKSVYVDTEGQFLKLVFHQNHANKYNVYNQVALVAMNIIGDPVGGSDESTIASREKLIDHYLGQRTEDPALEGTCSGKSDHISPLDDLAFDMYQDPEVAQIIRKLDERKREAVQQERYDYAKKLKQAIADLQKVGERLGRYEVEKRCAVEKEDYDLAKHKKRQMEQYRAQVYAQLELHSLVDMEPVPRPMDLPLQPLVHSSSSCHLPPALPPPQDDSVTENQRAEPVPLEQPSSHSLDVSLQRSPSDQPLSPSHPSHKAHVGTSVPWREPTPARRRQPGTAVEPEKRDLDASEAPRAGAAGEPEPLTEKALREASSAIEVLGEALVAQAYSKTWSFREDALLTLHQQLVDTPVGTPKEDLKGLLRAAVFLIRKSIRDIVTPVFQASLKVLKMLLTQYIPKHKLSKLETTHCVERTVPVLLARTGDSSARLRVMASNFIQEMALCKEVKSLQMVPSYLVQPLKANASAHLALSQVALLSRLLRDLGTDSTGFTVENVMKFAVRALQHRVLQVREMAVCVILDLYRQHRSVVLEYLPPDDSISRKNILFKTIFEGFAEIDGRPTDAEIRAQKRAATEEAEKQKKEEIKALQGQLAALKEMQAGAQVGGCWRREKGSEAAKAKSPDPDGRSAAPCSPPEASENPGLDNLCIFCGERSSAFTEEGLDLHYWKHCLMLTRCGYCRQVVEIASLTDHLLTECDKRDGFGRCCRCSEAVPKEELPRHVASKDCHPAKPEKLANRCPLCHENFAPGEEAWKVHLMGPVGCTMNLRRTCLLFKAPAPLQGKGPDTAKPGTSGLKAGSKIPTPKGGLSRCSGRTYRKR
ncbi:PREDICTED: centrosomal protein of 104 kDa [Myotis brandtii]|uniref:centrosomal protein of 104 kDa n=1 Tax=Myotis brandtii TaxID=109478 RepID=UPI0007046CAE|nr:PREDICTED: centrosomal protein of 104 kDa [Myotis brandtii]